MTSGNANRRIGGDDGDDAGGANGSDDDDGDAGNADDGGAGDADREGSGSHENGAGEGREGSDEATVREADKDLSVATANGGDPGSGGGGGYGSGGVRKFPKTRLWRQSQDRYAWRADVGGAGTAARVAFNAVRRSV